MITLPYAGNTEFHVNSLINLLTSRQNDRIVIGAQQCALDDHSKQHSLDYWLRSQIVPEQYRNTKQAVNAVIEQICSTERFQRIRVIDTSSPHNRICNHIMLINHPVQHNS